MASPGTQLQRRAPASDAGRLLNGVQTLWTRTHGAWAAMAPKQRGWAMTSFALVAALLVGVAWLGLRTNWRILYSGLDPADAREIGVTLTQAQIPFDVSDGGTTLRVSAAQLDKARLATATKGVKSGRMGFELFDRPNWVGSEFDERVNYQRALEGELEHTVGSLSDIESARVHLVMAHDSLFRDEERPAKASVVLKLRHASLADGEADSIRNLVASAVDGLAPDRVVLVDATGRIALGPRSAETMRLRAEQALEEKVVSTLEPVTGVGNVRAAVTIDYDTDAIDETKENYDPAQSATLSMERTEQTIGGQTVAAGVPGTASNAPNSQPLPVFPKQTSAPQTSKTESGTYGVSKTVRHLVESSGRIRRLTAAVVVNDRLLQEGGKGKTVQWAARTPEEIRNLTALAQAAVGFDAGRGDVVAVEGMGFDENRAKVSPSVQAKLLHEIQGYPDLIRYVSLLVGLGAVLLFGIRPALRKVYGMSQANGQLAAGTGRESTVAALPSESSGTADLGRARAQQIYEQVASHIKNEPTQSSRLLQSWIHSDGG